MAKKIYIFLYYVDWRVLVNDRNRKIAQLRFVCGGVGDVLTIFVVTDYYYFFF